MQGMRAFGQGSEPLGDLPKTNRLGAVHQSSPLLLQLVNTL